MSRGQTEVLWLLIALASLSLFNRCCWKWLFEGRHISLFLSLSVSHLQLLLIRACWRSVTTRLQYCVVYLPAVTHLGLIQTQDATGTEQSISHVWGGFKKGVCVFWIFSSFHISSAMISADPSWHLLPGKYIHDTVASWMIWMILNQASLTLVFGWKISFLTRQCFTEDLLLFIYLLVRLLLASITWWTPCLLESYLITYDKRKKVS